MQIGAFSCASVRVLLELVLLMLRFDGTADS